MSGYFSSIFASSPISPLKQHMAKAQQCIELLEPFFKAVFDEDFIVAASIQAQIATFENQADDLKKALRLQLPNNMFMPVSRADILNVLVMQDRIANKSKEISGIILGRRIIFPKSLQSLYKKFIKKSIQASEQAQLSIGELDELVEVGFRGGEVKLVKKLLTKLDKIESETDDIEKEVRTTLFKIETKLNPVEVMFLYKLIDATGDLGDIAQRVGSRLQLMLAR